MNKSYTSGDSSDDMPDYNVQSDADTLHKHQQISSDPDRHAAAHAELEKRQQDTDDAVKASDKTKKMHARVKKGLKKSFPSAGDSGATPFEKAAGGDK